MTKEIEVLRPTAYRRGNNPTAELSLPFGSALLFLAFSVVGMYLYRLLDPIIGSMECRPYEAFSSLLELPALPIVPLFLNIFSFLKEEAVFLTAAFLFTFCYFTRFICGLLLSLRALSLGMAFGYVLTMFQAGLVPLSAMTGFLVLEACFSSVYLLYVCRAVLLSREIRRLGRHHTGLLLKLSFGHLLRTVMCGLLLIFVAFLITLIL